MNYLELGLNCIAVNEHKRAIFQWKDFQSRMITRLEFEAQMSDPKAKGVAVICGAVSGGLEVIDIDTKYQTYDLWEKIKERLHEGIFAKLHIVKTRNGGYHLYYRCEVVEGNSKLANRPATPEEIKANPHLKTLTIIETRGEAGYVVAPPTEGYEVLQSKGIPLLSVEEREHLMEIMRSFNEVVEEEIVETAHRPSPKEYGISPFDEYNQRGDIEALLTKHGWKKVANGGARAYYLRPGGESSHSGSYNMDMGLFSVFSTNTPFTVGKGYRPASVYAILECNGDLKKAARQLLDEGYGERKGLSRVDSELVKMKVEGITNEDLVTYLITRKDYTKEEAHLKVKELKKNYGPDLRTFWDVKYKNKEVIPVINRYKLQKFLSEVGGYKLYFYDANSQIYRLIRVKDGFVEESSSENIKKFIKDYIDRLDSSLVDGVSQESLLELIYQGSSVLFSDAFFEFFERANLKFLCDTKDAAYFPFKNGVVEVRADGVRLKSYGELESVIWKSQVIDHQVVIEQDLDMDKVEYWRFLKLINGSEDERLVYGCGLIGYLLHKYKDPARPFSVILCEETENEAKGGGTGKGIFVKALSFLNNTVRVDGKNFKIDKNFAFQRVDLDTRILAIEDTRKNVDFEGFYAIITEGITVEKKNKDELFIPYKDSPKVMFTTNYTLPSSGNHAKRRQKVLEFASYFGLERTPEDEFGHKLFDDWDKDEWNRFFNMMFECVRDYLENGVMEMEKSDKLIKKQIKVQFGEEFLEYFTGFLAEEDENWISQEQLYNDFLAMHGFEKKDYSVKRFSKAVEESCTFLKISCTQKREKASQNKKVYKFSRTKEHDEELF